MPAFIGAQLIGSVAALAVAQVLFPSTRATRAALTTEHTVDAVTTEKPEALNA